MHYINNVIINSICVSNENEQTIIILQYQSNNNYYVAKFHNSTKIEINIFSLPHSIDELMIEDNSIKGWQKDVRYSVSDYENLSISFYCENYDISLSPADLQ